MVHRAGMKRRDLIVVEIGDDERLRGERSVDRAHAVDRNPELNQTFAIGGAVVAQRRHHDRLAAERMKVVRDVAGAAAPFAAHFAHLEAHREHMRLVGQDVTCETVGKHHDGVVRERAADQRAHGQENRTKARECSSATPSPACGEG